MPQRRPRAENLNPRKWGGSGTVFIICNHALALDKAGSVQTLAKRQPQRAHNPRVFRCSYADKAGDQVFEEFMTNGPASLGSPIVYKGKWLGGTGKFEGLSGEFEIHPTPVLISETLVQGSGKKTGTYHITKPPVAQK